MKSHQVKIEFLTDYLQARFTENAKAELENYISKGVVKSEEDSWKVLLYEDENGVYIPSNHIRGALVNAGKEFKIKKQKRSMKQWVISNVVIEPERLYLKKEQPDKIVTSYPARKDGSRVTLRHPAFIKGTQVEFFLNVLWDDKMETKAIKDLVEMAGQMYGIGARRADMFGRFKVISFS